MLLEVFLRSFWLLLPHERRFFFFYHGSQIIIITKSDVVSSVDIKGWKFLIVFQRRE